MSDTIVSISPAPSDSRTAYVYFIEDSTGFIKIGSSRDPEGRLAQLQTASPSQLDLLAVTYGGSAEEARLHVKFDDVRSCGEWFFGSKSLRRYINLEVARQIEAVYRSALAGKGPNGAVGDILERRFDSGDGEPSRLKYWPFHRWSEFSFTNRAQELGVSEMAYELSRLIIKSQERTTGEMFEAHARAVA